MSDVRMLIGQLYETLHVREHYATMEKQVLAELEAVRLELEPLEQVNYFWRRSFAPTFESPVVKIQLLRTLSFTNRYRAFTLYKSKTKNFSFQSCHNIQYTSFLKYTSR